ncbi:MAG: hypothetical protein LIO94_11230 [Clostridiales bacterium]|nr:hypothetical protein [Clostridiales bacterium]
MNDKDDLLFTIFLYIKNDLCYAAPGIVFSGDGKENQAAVKDCNRQLRQFPSLTGGVQLPVWLYSSHHQENKRFR